MASQSLYRKWRSQKFGELIGQEPIIRTLKNALSSGKPAHAYLFTGPRGTGKTSTARLLAKTINCANPHDGEPCNECQQCREITAGNSFNVIEIDAASNRGIDSIRDLREKVMMPPSTGKYKVYVLDEAHMLTTEAFNALLKTLEEPPGYAIFVLATTDVHKMLPTVLSRCQRFDFKRITTRQIVEHLNFVAEQEHITLERAAAELIARAAAGGMRDALSLLDQAIAYCGEAISLAQVQTMLGVADPRAIHKLIMHVADLNSSGGLHLIHELAEAGADLRQLNAQVGEYWRALMLARAGADITTILDLTEDETSEITQTARLFGLEELTECARIFAQNDLVQKNQGTPQLGLELAFLACIELHRRPQASQSPSVAPASATQPRPAMTLAPPRTTVSYPSFPVQPAAGPPAHPSAPQKRTLEEGPSPLPDWDDLPPPVEDYNVPEPTPAGERSDAASRRNPQRSEFQSFAPTADLSANVSTNSPVVSETSTPAAAQNDADLPPLTVQQVKNAWDRVVKRVKQRSPTTAAMLKYYNIVGVEDMAGQSVIVIQAQKQGHYNYVHENDRSKDIEWALTTEFNRQCKVRLLSPGQALPGASAPPSWEAGTRSRSAAPAVAPQQSAHLERGRPQGSPLPPAPSSQGESAVPNGLVQDGRLSYDTDAVQSRSLARTDIVSENTSIVSSQETIEQKARRDPIVQEVMKTFAARIVSIQPK
jgi:DNA polymerase-3 subunit gamma/tau